MKKVGLISRITVDTVYAGIPRLPEPGEELLCKQFTLAPGGGAIVSAVSLQRLGVPVKAGLYMGRGLEGEIAALLLKREGLGSYVDLTRGGQPVVFSSVMSYDGERSIVSYDEGPPPMEDGEALAFFEGCPIVFLPDAYTPARALAGANKLVVCDPNMPRLEQVREMLPYIHVFTPNKAEALALSGKASPLEALDWLLEQGVRWPVVKLGGEGCLCRVNDSLLRVSDGGLFACVDSTGAGDNFMAGLLYGLARELPMERCLRLATIFGGASTTGLGAFAQKLAAGEIDELEAKTTLTLL